MRLIGIAVAGMVGATLGFSSCSSQNINVKIKTDVDSMSYALGVNFAEQFKQSDIDQVNPLALARGLSEGMNNEATMTLEEVQEFLANYFTRLQETQAQAALEEGRKFLEENAKQPGVVVLESGLQYKVITEGTGPKPGPESEVKVHYRGTLIDGTEFDSSHARGVPAQFQLNRVIQGWQEGLQLMNEGSKYMLYIPSELGYGANPRPGGPIRPNSVLIFEVELLDVID